MHPLEKKITNLLQEKPLFADCDAVVIGVSGGPDSLALLHVLAACLPDIDIIAVYVDHGLRPAETKAEAELVCCLAAELGLKFVSGAVKVRKHAETTKISIEHSARDLRYAFLHEVAEEYDAQRIAVAHTADDQAEEVLLRMIRGAGRRGLAGMDFLNDANVVRPFLNIEKAELLAYLADNNIPFAQDSSNTDRMYLRNRVRLDLIPFLEEGFNSGVKNNLRKLADIFRAEDDLLADLTSQAFAASVEKITPVAPGDNALGIWQINLDKFSGLHLAIRRRVLEKLFLRLSNEPSYRKITRCIELTDGKDQAVAHFSQGLRVGRAGGLLLFSYPQGRINKRGNLAPATPMYLETEVAGPGVYPFGDATIEISVVDLNDAGSHLPAGAAGYLDHDKLCFPFIMRSFMPGDRFRPFGGLGEKKVKDFFIDRKIPRSSRSAVPIVVAAGKIAGLPGLRADAAFAVGAETTQALKFIVLSEGDCSI